MCACAASRSIVGVHSARVCGIPRWWVPRTGVVVVAVSLLPSLSLSRKYELLWWNRVGWHFFFLLHPALSTWQSFVHVLRRTVVPTTLLIIPLTTPCFSQHSVPFTHLATDTPESSCFFFFFFLHLVSILLCKEKQSLVTCSMRPKCVVCVRVCVRSSGLRGMSCVSECSQRSVVCIATDSVTVLV